MCVRCRWAVCTHMHLMYWPFTPLRVHCAIIVASKQRQISTPQVKMELTCGTYMSRMNGQMIGRRNNYCGYICLQDECLKLRMQRMLSCQRCKLLLGHRRNDCKAKPHKQMTTTKNSCWRLMVCSLRRQRHMRKPH